MKHIDTLDQWLSLANMLSVAGYRLAQSQDESAQTEGYVARLIASGRPDIDISTNDADVYEAILNYKPEGFERG